MLSIVFSCATEDFVQNTNVCQGLNQVQLCQRTYKIWISFLLKKV